MKSSNKKRNSCWESSYALSGSSQTATRRSIINRPHTSLWIVNLSSWLSSVVFPLKSSSAQLTESRRKFSTRNQLLACWQKIYDALSKILSEILSELRTPSWSLQREGISKKNLLFLTEHCSVTEFQWTVLGNSRNEMHRKSFLRGAF